MFSQKAERALVITRARASVVTVPPIGAAAIYGLVIQPAATTIAISVAVIARPPPNTRYEDIVVEVVVEVMVVHEVIVIVAMHIAMPGIMSTIPGVVTRATMPRWTKTPACDVASMPTTPGKARATHSAKVSMTHSAEVTAAHSTKMATSAKMTSAEAVPGVRLPH